MEFIEIIEIKTNPEESKLAEIQKDIIQIREDNKCAEIIMKFQDGKLLQYNLTEKKRWNT
jgi:hypothetical protein